MDSFDGPRSIRNIPCQDVSMWGLYKLPSPIKLGEHAKNLIYQNVKEAIASNIADEHSETLPQDETFLNAVEEARGFIQTELGYEQAAPIYYQYLPENYKGYYNSLNDVVAVEPPRGSTVYRDYVGTVSVLVHEMAHESSSTHRLVITEETTEKNTRGVHIYSLFGMYAIKFMRGTDATRCGEFFEEAFAEHQAVRWREEKIPGYKEAGCVWETGYGFSAPVKYHTPSRPLIGSGSLETHIPYVMNAAYGMELMGECLGVDIFAIIQRARQKETEATAKREFVRTVESLQKGLHKKLRDLRYDEGSGDFQRGFSMIQDAISGYKRTQSAEGMDASLDGTDAASAA